MIQPPQDFTDLLRFMFRKRRGRRYVELGRYNLTDVASIDQPITTALWSSKVKPGATIAMNIVLRRSAHMDTPESRHCPVCRFFCSWASLGDDVTWYFELLPSQKRTTAESFLLL